MKTRETNKKLYISNFTEAFIYNMKDTIFTEESERTWIELKAGNQYEKRKADIKDKADALMYGCIDAKAEAERIKATF